MSEEKAFDIKRFAEELEALPDSAFSKPDEHEKNPYRMAEEVANGNPLRMRKCLELISEILLTIDVEAWENCSAMFSESPCRGDAVVRLIEDSLWLTFGGVQLRCLQCGMGKSSAISYVIRDVIEYGDGSGILIATDSIERLKGYMAPRFDPELAAFLKAHESSITLIESANKVEALQRMRSTPVLLMTTQRYFSMSVAEINDILHGSGIQRDAVIIDEKPIIKTVETVSRTDVNKVASALSDGLRSYENHEEKRWMIAFWEEIRNEFMRVVQAYEDAHIGTTPFFAKYNGMLNLQQQECCDFRKALEKHRNILRRFDPDCLGRCERILNVVLEGGLFYGDSGQYYRSCFYVVVNRWDRLDAVDATVVVLDGTADIHPDYDTQDVIQVRPTGLPSRKLSNLTLQFVNVDASKQRLTTEDRTGQHKQAILRYLGSLGIDRELTPLFTYKDCEPWFRTRGMKRTGHFGDIKGRNNYADAADIVQVGMNLYTQQDYLTLWLADHPETRDEILSLPTAEMNEELDALRRSDEVIELQNRILLADLEQNMYRGAIRRRDFDGQATFYVLCDTNMHRQLIEMAKERYAKLDVKVVVVAETPTVVQRAKREKRKAKDPVKGTARQRFLVWYEACPPGVKLTKRKLLLAANVSESDLKNLGKKNSAGEYYDQEVGPLLAAMHIGRDLYMKPTDDPEQPVTD